jgi:hypothetical protein
MLASQPVLAIYSLTADTALHCDASSLGFGTVIFQRQNKRMTNSIPFHILVKERMMQSLDIIVLSWNVWQSFTL